MRALVISQFQYCPLVWMFHSRHLNNTISRIHERALRIAYKDYESSFNTLLEKDNSVSIHAKSLQTLMIEIVNLMPCYRFGRRRKTTSMLRPCGFLTQNKTCIYKRLRNNSHRESGF